MSALVDAAPDTEIPAAAIPIEATRANMREKLAWAQRCITRMRIASAEHNQLDFQDHFWSFLHATRLIWFYFARWTKSVGAENARSLATRWELKLSESEKRFWKAMQDLRAEDVHVQPVSTSLLSSTKPITYEGLPVTLEGKRIVMTTVTQQVEWKDEQLDALELSDRGIALLQRFTDEFPGSDFLQTKR
jgi:hypothetical protein